MSFEQWGYIGVLAMLLACSLGLPLPEDVPLLTGGLLCYKGLTNIWLMILVGLTGVLSGDFFLFWLGRRFGHHIVEHRLFRRLVNPSRLLTAERLFEHHGFKIIFVGRFLPGLRPMLWVACGVLRVPFWIFALVNGAAACISVPTLIFLGKLFGHSFTQLQKDVRSVMHAILLVVGAAVLAIGAYYFHRRQKGLIAEEGPERQVDAATLAHLPPAAEPAEVAAAHPAAAPPDPPPTGGRTKPA